MKPMKQTKTMKNKQWEKQIEGIIKVSCIEAQNNKFITPIVFRQSIKLLEIFAQQQERVIEMLENEKKSVKELFPDAIPEPTVKYSLQVEEKNYYNKALNRAIELIKEGE